MNVDPRNILEPLDPLNISFSADKCVKTPQTHRTDKNRSSTTTQSMRKNPRQLFYQRTPSQQNRKAYSPKVSKFETVYKPCNRFLELEAHNWSQRNSGRKNGKAYQIGSYQNSHLQQMSKLDFLISKINLRIQISKNICRF